MIQYVTQLSNLFEGYGYFILDGPIEILYTKYMQYIMLLVFIKIFGVGLGPPTP